MEPFNLLLITYKNRSGSTLLSNWLSSDERILVLPEGGEITHQLLSNASTELDNVFIDRLKNKLTSDPKLSGWNINDLALKISYTKGVTGLQLLKIILNHYKEITKPAAEVFVLKHPRFIKVLDQLNISSADANLHLLFLVRDGRSIYASSKKSLQSNIPFPMECDPVRSAKSWNNFISTAKKYMSQQKNNIKALLIKYEDLLIKKAETINAIYSFIGLPYDSSKIKEADLAERISKKQKHLHTNINSNVDKQRIDSWKTELSPWEIYFFEKKSSKNLTSLNYDLSNISYNKLQHFFLWFKLRGNAVLNNIKLYYHKL